MDVTESNARWVQDFRLKAYASPAKLESIDGRLEMRSVVASGQRIPVEDCVLAVPLFDLCFPPRCPVPCPPDSQLSWRPDRSCQQWVPGSNTAALPL